MGSAAVMEPVDMRVSGTRVRKDVGVRLPPAALGSCILSDNRPVLELHGVGLNNCELSRQTGVSRPTIRDWVNDRLHHSYRSRPLEPRPPMWRENHNFDGFGPNYGGGFDLRLAQGRRCQA